MAGIEVATVVASIISAFGNGMDVFRRITGRRRKKQGREATPSEEEVWLRRSLEDRPLDIRQSYDRSVAKLGRQFEIGDSAAHSSLAHTLLILNTGLIKLINHALSNDTPTRNLSTRSLLNLSEVAASDTLRALSQLSLRLSTQPQVQYQQADTRKLIVDVAKPDNTQNKTAPRKKRPGPAPLLVRGGWIRPKSSSTASSTSSSTSQKKSAATKHQRSSSEPKTDHNTGRPEVNSPPESDTSQKPRVEASNSYSRHESESRASRDKFFRSESPAKHRRQPERQPSMLIVPSDFFTSQQQNIVEELAPPRPPKIPLETRPNITFRPRPPSTSTFMTVSTKIGEIPENSEKEHMPPLTENRQSRGPVRQKPSAHTHDNDEHRRQGRGIGFKFWKRDGLSENRIRQTMAY